MFITMHKKEGQMYKRGKSVKLSLKHLNDCFYVFKEISKQQKITEENESQYINVLLNSYLMSDNIIEQEKIDKYIGNKETENKVILSYDDLVNLQKIKNIRLETSENKNIQKTK